MCLVLLLEIMHEREKERERESKEKEKERLNEHGFYDPIELFLPGLVELDNWNERERAQVY